MFGKKTSLIDPDKALPGRAQRLRVPERHEVLGTPLEGPWPDGLATAMFGMGCFWGAERIFWQLPGVHSTFVGYAGGFTPNASYEEVCTGRTGHAEVVVVVYDPTAVDYETLLKHFWENHDPTQGMRQGNDVGTQYRRAARDRRAVEGAIPGTARRRRFRTDHDRDHSRARRLSRRVVSPAVPVQESQRVLQPRVLSGGL